jgi:hypothetical protein
MSLGLFPLCRPGPHALACSACFLLPPRTSLRTYDNLCLRNISWRTTLILLSCTYLLSFFFLQISQMYISPMEMVGTLLCSISSSSLPTQIGIEPRASVEGVVDTLLLSSSQKFPLQIGINHVSFRCR